jgi:hypothetical protein
MTRDTEIQLIAQTMGMSTTDVKVMWTRYGRKPKGYRRVVEVNGDAKTSKGVEYGYLSGIIYFAPGSLSGHNVCSSATIGCLLACLAFEGHGGIVKPGHKHSFVTMCRIAKTLRYFESDNSAFIASMLHDCFRLIRSACRAGLIPCVRPNGTSDLPKLAWIIAAAFPTLTVYDYTKHIRPYDRTRSNYSLTFSYSGSNKVACLDALHRGINVTMVFAKGKPLPATMWGYKVINGDKHDLRFLDERNVIVGLTAKGRSSNKAQDSAGFIVLQ